jgi:hypothetical protein
VEWEWVNEQRLTWALDKITDDSVLDDLLDALDDVLADPYGETVTSPMRGTMYRMDRFIAPLPHGYFVVFSPYPDGIPPSTSRPSLLVRAFVSIADLEW